MRDLSIVIPARNEMFLKNTVENILENITSDTEVIIISDGCWPDPPLEDHERVVVIHHAESIGQRAATNEGVRVSTAKHVMKIDAHCAVDEGFDTKLIADCRPDWTMVPTMYKLHAFDWICEGCNRRSYQGSMPRECPGCPSTNFRRDILWKRKDEKPTISWRFNDELQFKYWRKHRKRKEAQGDLVETMSFIGACMLMTRDRYWELDGLDERHGSWGQFGTEIALKSWLSGGKLITSKKTWFAHLFRTGNFARYGEASWPYPITNEQIERAREYSRDFWFNNRWPKAIHPVSWLVEKFKPVPDWHEGAK
jgi:glycosyltransferase involved in cell wall biosynthesis